MYLMKMMNEERLVKDDVLFGAVGGWVLVCSGCTLCLVECCSWRRMGFSMFRMHCLVGCCP